MSFNPLSAEDHAAVLEDITIRFDRRATMEALKAKMAELRAFWMPQMAPDRRLSMALCLCKDMCG